MSHANDEPRASRLHGGMDPDELRSLGLCAEDIIDFSVNTNPYGPSPGMLEVLRRARLDRYPHPTALPARQVLAALCEVEVTQVVVGHGAAELLWSLAHRLVRPGETLLTVEPTFSELRLAATALGANTVAYHANAQDDFRIDLHAVAELAHREHASVIYLCAPNSPTGVAVAAPTIAAFAADQPERTVIVDQSFLSLSDAHMEAQTPMPGNVVRLRSLTKDHGLPGLRVGYALCRAELAERLQDLRPSWPLSSLAEAAIAFVPKDQAFVAESRTQLATDRGYIVESLLKLGLTPIASIAPYICVHVGDAPALRKHLLHQHRLLVRDCTSFGLPNYLRIAVRPQADSERLMKALAQAR